MKAFFVTTLLLQMSLFALSYERYPAWIAGFRTTDESAYIFLPYYCDKAPVVESIIWPWSCYEWERPAQQAWIIGDYWCISVAISSDRCCYRAYRTELPRHTMNGLVMPAITILDNNESATTVNPKSLIRCYRKWKKEWG